MNEEGTYLEYFFFCMCFLVSLNKDKLIWLIVFSSMQKIFLMMCFNNCNNTNAYDFLHIYMDKDPGAEIRLGNPMTSLIAIICVNFYKEEIQFSYFEIFDSEKRTL